MLSRRSVRRPLLLAFFGISGFAVLAAGTAMFSFLRIDDLLDRITHQRLPTVQASQELSRQAERIVAAAPALLTLGSAEEQEALSEKITEEVERLNELLQTLKESGVDPSDLEEIERLVEWLGLNLISLDVVAFNSLAMRERTEALLQELSDTVATTKGLLAPGIREMDMKVAEWNRSVVEPGLSASERVERLRQRSATIVSLLPLEKALLQASAISDVLLMAAAAQDATQLAELEHRLADPLNRFEGLAADLPTGLRDGLLAQTAQFRRLAEGRSSLFLARRRQLEHIAGAGRQMSENADLSLQLTEAVDQLVARTNLTESQNMANLSKVSTRYCVKGTSKNSPFPGVVDLGSG